MKTLHYIQHVGFETPANTGRYFELNFITNQERLYELLDTLLR